MTIYYPPGLPVGLHAGRAYQIQSPLMRTTLSSGRARQRRRFTDVPQYAKISWMFTDAEAVTFETWWRDGLTDGALWFEMPLKVPEGFSHYVCRFTDVYSGPNLIGPNLWGYSAELEMFERPLPAAGWGEFPEFLLEADIIDYAMNREWPLNPWQTYADALDTAINEDWPQP